MNTTKTIRYDEETKEYLIEFTSEELELVGWQQGDTLVWIDNKDGSWTLKKKEDSDG